jgi:hypothetical protein
MGIMKSYLTKRWYTNFILTVIAVLLGISCLSQYLKSVSICDKAYAQDFPARTSSFSSPGKSAPVDTSNVATVQDLAVARATSEVAAANREIASAVRDLAKAVQDLGANITRAMNAPKTQGATGSSSDIRVEVGR